MIPCSEENFELLSRLYFLKRHMKVSVPENIVQLRATFNELKLEANLDGIHDIDLYYQLGLVIRQNNEPMTMGELSHALEVPLSTATRVVDLLVKHDYVKRLSDPDDRRVVRVALTETGLKVQQTMNAFLLERLSLILCKFTDEERLTMIRLINKFCEVIEETE
jgi:DNA-binding MarR family transcriptional regulator